MFAPFFPEYDVFIKNASAKTFIVNPDNKNFYPDFDDLKNKITNKTKAVIINSSNNPTVVFYNENIIKKIVEVINEKKQTIL